MRLIAIQVRKKVSFNDIYNKFYTKGITALLSCTWNCTIATVFAAVFQHGSVGLFALSTFKCEVMFILNMGQKSQNIILKYRCFWPFLTNN